jgi:hypothetical protein
MESMTQEARRGKTRRPLPPLPEADIKDRYCPMLQGPGTNLLKQVTTRSIEPVINAITGQGTISKGSLTVFFEAFKDFRRSLRVSTHKLLDVCVLELTRQNDHKGTKPLNLIVNIDIDDYMKKCGIPLTKPSRDRTRRTIAEDLETLYNASLDWTEREGDKKGKNFAKMRIIVAQMFGRRNVAVSFSPHLAQYLTQEAYIMQYPLALFQVDNRNEAAYMLGYKLALHHSIDNNTAKGTADIISVKALLESCPAIPNEKEVREGKADRHFELRIIKPFEKALDSLVEVGLLSRWEYCNSKHEPLTKTQLESMDYEVFSKCYICFDLSNAPDQTPRLEANKKRRIRQAQRTGKNSADKKKISQLEERVAELEKGTAEE